MKYFILKQIQPEGYNATTNKLDRISAENHEITSKTLKKFTETVAFETFQNTTMYITLSHEILNILVFSILKI